MQAQLSIPAAPHNRKSENIYPAPQCYNEISVPLNFPDSGVFFFFKSEALVDFSWLCITKYVTGLGTASEVSTQEALLSYTYIVSDYRCR